MTLNYLLKFDSSKYWTVLMARTLALHIFNKLNFKSIFTSVKYLLNVYLIFHDEDLLDGLAFANHTANLRPENNYEY